MTEFGTIQVSTRSVYLGSRVESIISSAYDLLELAYICYVQAATGDPLPWEDGYEQSVLESMFA